MPRDEVYHVPYTAQQISDAIGKGPTIINGVWYVWDVTQSMYITTGINATGPQGSTGKTAYEYATEHGYTGTEEQFSEQMSAIDDYVAEAAQSARDAEAAKDDAEAAAQAARETAHFTDFDTGTKYTMAWGAKGGYPCLRLTEIEEE